MTANNQISTDPALLSTEIKKEAPVARASSTETCANDYGLMIALAIVMVSIMVPVGILAQKIKILKAQLEIPTSEMAKFDSAPSKKQLNIKPEESVEAHLKKDEVN